MTAATPALDEPRLLACHECDLLMRERALAPGERARCPRCGCGLYEEKPRGVEHALALCIASLFLMVLANAFPFMIFSLDGRVQESTLFSGVLELWRGGMAGLAALVFAATIAVPLLRIAGLAVVLGAVHTGRSWPHLARVFRAIDWLGPWGMMEVFMLGVLVALVKLSQMATILFGVSFYAFVALIIVSTAAGSALDPRAVWTHLERTR